MIFVMELNDRSLPVLSAEEVRILGCLVEKELTTPDNYPLTLNSLLAACNQKTSREPVVEFDAATVELGLRSLKERGFVRSVTGAEHRVPKFKHDMPFMLRLNPAQTAVLTVLMLRGPQTVGEIRGRSERVYSFGSLDEVAGALTDLKDLNGRKLVMELERLPGTKEPRFAHLLSGEDAIAIVAVAEIERGSGVFRGEELGALREELQELRNEVATLRAELIEFRKQFD
ncbi:MAG: YceH family protein [Bryobacterales bacterium]|nr:YceH family protein [Bryobacterales bacterium]